MGTPVWSRDGIICAGESYKDKLKLTLAKGASLKIRPVSSTQASTETCAVRSTFTMAKKLTSPPSRRPLAKRSPSTVLANRNLRKKRSPEGSWLCVTQ